MKGATDSFKQIYGKLKNHHRAKLEFGQLVDLLFRFDRDTFVNLLGALHKHQTIVRFGIAVLPDEVWLGVMRNLFKQYQDRLSSLSPEETEKLDAIVNSGTPKAIGAFAKFAIGFASDAVNRGLLVPKASDRLANAIELFRAQPLFGETREAQLIALAEDTPPPKSLPAPFSWAGRARRAAVTAAVTFARVVIPRW